MKNPQILLLFVFAFFLLGITSVKAQENKLRYVWAKSGLVIRDAPSKEGKRIGKLAYGDSISIVETTDFRNLIKVLEVEDESKSVIKDLYLKGIWVKVRRGSVEGFVFDAYLSNLPALRFISDADLEPIETWGKREFGIREENNSKPIPNSDYSKREIIFNNGISSYSEKTTGGGEGQIIIPGARINEGFLLFDNQNLFKVFSSSEFEQNQILIESDHSVLILYESGSISIKQEGNNLIIYSEGGC